MKTLTKQLKETERLMNAIEESEGISNEEERRSYNIDDYETDRINTASDEEVEAREWYATQIEDDNNDTAVNVNGMNDFVGGEYQSGQAMRKAIARSK